MKKFFSLLFTIISISSIARHDIGLCATGKKYEIIRRVWLLARSRIILRAGVYANVVHHAPDLHLICTMARILAASEVVEVDHSVD